MKSGSSVIAFGQHERYPSLCNHKFIRRRTQWRTFQCFVCPDDAVTYVFGIHMMAGSDWVSNVEKQMTYKTYHTRKCLVRLATDIAPTSYVASRQ